MGVLRVRLLVGSVLVSLAVAGCSDPKPTLPDPTVSPSPSTASPSESATPQPESAEDFIRRWVEVSNEMQNTGETAEYLSLSQACKACREVAAHVQSIYSKGGYVDTDGWTILRMSLESKVRNRCVYRVVVSSAPTEYTESADGPTKTFDGGRVIERLELSKRAGWHVVDISQYAS